jgi:hypothetical protein
MPPAAAQYSRTQAAVARAAAGARCPSCKDSCLWPLLLARSLARANAHYKADVGTLCGSVEASSIGCIGPAARTAVWLATFWRANCRRAQKRRCRVVRCHPATGNSGNRCASGCMRLAVEGWVLAPGGCNGPRWQQGYQPSYRWRNDFGSLRKARRVTWGYCRGFKMRRHHLGVNLCSQLRRQRRHGNCPRSSPIPLAATCGVPRCEPRD